LQSLLKAFCCVGHCDLLSNDISAGIARNIGYKNGINRRDWEVESSKSKYVVDSDGARSGGGNEESN
jgi:hypothetical protein